MPDQWKCPAVFTKSSLSQIYEHVPNSDHIKAGFYAIHLLLLSLKLCNKLQNFMSKDWIASVALYQKLSSTES